MTHEPKAPMADARALSWEEHPRIPGVQMKTLLTSAHNSLANAALVEVPVGSAVTRHSHEQEVETVYVLEGESKLVLEDQEVPFHAGQIVAIPKGMEHALINTGTIPVKLLTFFTPPLV